jgi:hypothetical protein
MNRGIITTYVLVFGAIFLILISGLLSFILLQIRQSEQRLAWNQSLHIAEAGLNYYRWCLNNEIEQDCQVERDYYDLSGNFIGRFLIEDFSNHACGEIVSRRIIVTGWTNSFSNVKRKISVFYGRKSIAEYAYLLNDNVWAGEDREIRGLYHSNAGIRMDGENQSLVVSARDSWICTSSFGCDYLNCPLDCSREGNACRCPGVFTSTNNARTDLFNFPVPSFDFDGITIDLAKIKLITSAFPLEYYWPPATEINSQAKGYRIKFLDNGSFEIWIVTGTKANWAYDLERGWHYDYSEIQNEYQYSSQININPDCSLIFIEDNLWLEGEVKGKVTIVSADLIDPNRDTSIVISRNIDYTSQGKIDGSDGLSAISQRDILIGPDSLDQMELRGIFVAQKGLFGRKHYPDNIKEKMEITGSVVSNNRVGTKWTSGSLVVSGYLKRENYIDSNLIYNPPPFTPYTVSDFKIINWQEL